MAIADTGNITKAAKALYISQPSLTQYLRRLEDDLGVELFDRSSQPMKLTPAGELFRTYALRYYKLTSELEEQIAGLSDTSRMTVNIGIPTQVQPLFMESLIRPFMEQAPSALININGAPSPEQERMVTNGVIDVAILHIRSGIRPATEYIELADDPVLLVLNPDVLGAFIDKKGHEGTPDDPTPIDISLLKDVTFYLMEPPYLLRKVSDDILNAAGIKNRKISEISNIDLMLKLCSSGKGAAFVPASFCREPSQTEKLAFFTPEKHQVNLKYVLCFSSGERTKQTNSFISFVASRFNTDY